ncbi:MAG: Asp-tRNA(Asn)/Glu-tRNA(Gln) amidotransferase subunit GatC [Candidatus Pacebacteria bacterium]|nr:Asp-tRNA(Asn)/Glu-tRNA(Gln) amidotransferase subunit GatC [Candidatus Paceibacterota bacterium]
MISEQEIKNIAKLAHLKIKDEEIDKLRNDFSSILDYVNKLGEVDVSQISETANLSNFSNVERDDIPSRFDKELLIDSMPKQRNGYLEVKKVLYND